MIWHTERVFAVLCYVNIVAEEGRGERGEEKRRRRGREEEKRRRRGEEEREKGV